MVIHFAIIDFKGVCRDKRDRQRGGGTGPKGV